MQAVSLLHQAQTAAKAGRRQQAYRLLQQAIRQDPDNYHLWLWLAKTASSPEASLSYVKRAQRLMPEDALVKKALVWAEQRVAVAGSSANSLQEPPSASSSETPGRSWPRLIVQSGLALLALAVLLFAGVAIWYFIQPAISETAGHAGLRTAPTNTGSDGQHEVRLAANPVIAQPTATFTPTPTSPPILAKKVAGQSNAPRPTWTVTPSPTNTPTATPTPYPTFISAPWQKPEGRPLGVGLDERWVDVDLSEQTLYAYEGNSLIFESLISSGLPQHETVTGQFRIWYLTASQTMDGSRLGYDYYLDNVPYVMYFFEDYALHGTYWHNNFGHPMSHGCVNMRTQDAAWVFEWAKVGTLVNVHE